MKLDMYISATEAISMAYTSLSQPFYLEETLEIIFKSQGTPP
jgi:hypothetical protein